jgi:cytochrome c biogenesis protein CcmG, thiol:disulfide interchange protein DsbE
MDWINNQLNDTRRWSLITIGVLLLGSTWIWLTAVPSAATTGGLIPSPREGFAAPLFSLETLTGDSMALADSRGEVVIVNLWASWCPPCRAEMPALERVYQANKDRGLQVLAVNTTYQDSEAAAAAFISENNLNFPVLLDRTGDVGRLYQVRAMPSTFFVDRQGVIRKVIIGGPMSEATIETTVEQLLREEN